MRRTGVELIKRDTELPQAWEQLRLDVAVDGVVYPLVRSGLDIPVRLADSDHLGDFPGHVVADAEPLELAFFVKFVHGLEGLFVRCCTVRTMEVPHLDGARYRQ